MPNVTPSVPEGNWEGILSLARILRGPDGCPWDASLGLEALAGHLVEEAYEVLHAAREGSAADLAGEIGDVCFLIALITAAQEEPGGPPFEQIASGVVTKIARRHPHVFGGSGAVVQSGGSDLAEASRESLDPRAAALRWEEIKRQERREPGTDSESAGIAPVPPALPALLQALRVQQKAAGYGFDWPSADPVFAKVEEELKELGEAGELPEEQRRERMREEAGDLLFAVVNLTRLLGLDPEDALRGANRKFRLRFNLMVELASRDGAALETLPLEQMDAYWERAKLAGSPSQRAGTESEPPPGKELHNQ